MSRDRLYLFDTTLRDGAQTAGVEFSLEDKIAITKLIEELGVDYVEGGYPGANPVDTAFFEANRTKSAIFTAFGMTKRAGRSAANDPGVQGLVNSAAAATCFVAKAWDYQVHRRAPRRPCRHGPHRRCCGQGGAHRSRALF
jgi:2-isopropylmalate synthase